MTAVSAEGRTVWVPALELFMQPLDCIRATNPAAWPQSIEVIRARKIAGVRINDPSLSIAQRPSRLLKNRAV
jgi:hypothetical protein